MYDFLQEFEYTEDKDMFMEEYHRQTMDPKLFKDLYGDKSETEKKSSINRKKSNIKYFALFYFKLSVKRYWL